MMMPMQMGQPKEKSWEEIAEQLKIRIANSEKDLIIVKAELREVESRIENPVKKKE